MMNKNILYIYFSIFPYPKYQSKRKVGLVQMRKDTKEGVALIFWSVFVLIGTYSLYDYAIFLTSKLNKFEIYSIGFFRGILTAHWFLKWRRNK